MLKDANRRAMPRWRDWFARMPKSGPRVTDLRSILVGERVSAKTFEALGAHELAAYANRQALAALDELIEMGGVVMKTKIYETLQQGTPEWHEARRGIITASEIGKLVTKTGKIADNDKSRALIQEKAAQRVTGFVDVQPTSFTLQRGHDDEAEARDIYSANIAPVREVGFIRKEFEHVIIGYSPDGLVGTGGLIECKSRSQKFQIETIASLSMPIDYKAQVQAGMMISGRPWCDFISFPACGGGKMMVLRVEADKPYQNLLLEAATEAEGKIRALVEEYQSALSSGKAQFFDTERREYGDPSEVEFS